MKRYVITKDAALYDTLLDQLLERFKAIFREQDRQKAEKKRTKR